MDVSYAEVRAQNQPFSADRELIEAKIRKLCADKKEADDLLKLATIKAPEDVRDQLDDLVLTEEQREEIAKAGKALEHRQYLKDVGLYEIGKLLLVGPPGTGKTSSARALIQVVWTASRRGEALHDHQPLPGRNLQKHRQGLLAGEGTEPLHPLHR